MNGVQRGRGAHNTLRSMARVGMGSTTKRTDRPLCLTLCQFVMILILIRGQLFRDEEDKMFGGPMRRRSILGLARACAQ